MSGCLGRYRGILGPLAVRTQNQHFVLCVRNDSFSASLEPRKIYEIVPDREAQQDGLLRVIDESGEDYLYSKEFFVSVSVPEVAAEIFLRAS